jgi:hypothetical protein
MDASAVEPLVAIGKQRAAASSIDWDVREVIHPLLGAIKVAVQKTAVTTPTRGGKVVSSAFVSCQQAGAKIAIELANAPESDAASGLGPVDLPRIVCTSLRPQGDLVKADIPASWEIGGLGDALTRGISPSALRQCVSIEILQNLALPTGWPQSSQKVSMELMPYGRELDSIFAACGETTAYSPDTPPPGLRQSVAQLPPKVTSELPARAPEAAWQAARAITKGRTNVRRAASIDSDIVTHLDPGARIHVQPVGGDWWKVKPRKGPAFAGYVRRDRFTFE